MAYEIDYGNGWTTVYPNGGDVHQAGCTDEACDGCWSPEFSDAQPWFDALARDGVVLRARVLMGGHVLDERDFHYGR